MLVRGNSNSTLVTSENYAEDGFGEDSSLIGEIDISAADNGDDDDDSTWIEEEAGDGAGTTKFDSEPPPAASTSLETVVVKVSSQ